MTYLFDGSYNGLLTAVFQAFERKQTAINIAIKDNYQSALFENDYIIETNPLQAKRVLDGLYNRLSAQQAGDFWRVFLSEDDKIYGILFRLFVLIFQGQNKLLDNYGDAAVLYFHQTLKKVNRERHRMKAFIRFQQTADNLYFAIISPDFNVLPLILTFFKNRYADQAWLIYDERRQYGIHYDKHMVREVTLSFNESNALQTQQANITMDSKETLYQQLWQSYFQSTNIPARKNMKLHLQHVPKRYWRYLTEKKLLLND